MVSLPHALPAIFAGLKVSITLAVVGAVVGEFVGSNSGIGFVLQRSIGNFELPTMFAALVILSSIGVVLFWIIDVIERLPFPGTPASGTISRQPLKSQGRSINRRKSMRKRIVPASYAFCRPALLPFAPCRHRPPTRSC